ncbi:SGNH/GDSL hydrolase family protein [uncultured Psychroserpens sp.]|uniref:SGNH/GDSL hydrolase family protein n=1 Tax=uncultured Psychroserpens sp. TaxID=255436 RepID=UPI0026277F63|nr:SGNH/GDSL hydrolase family protein [uncultured Psychroserpens sp.]
MLLKKGKHFLLATYRTFATMRKTHIIWFLMLAIVMNCSSSDDTSADPVLPKTFKMLSLGDSYTIGQSVCDTCRFPEQLKDSLKQRYTEQDTFKLQVIAQTGWTTTNLINAIASETLTDDHDLVTLLIGVNNQFQGKPFSLYEIEFPQLIETAVTAAKGDKNNLIVLSIPDYAYTLFGQNFGNPATTSSQIDMYNNFAEAYCNEQNITFLNITDITRQGLDNPELIASDNLHPSEIAYSKFVERLLPLAIEKIE